MEQPREANHSVGFRARREEAISPKSGMRVPEILAGSVPEILAGRG
jgi:hypothetical protein